MKTKLRFSFNHALILLLVILFTTVALINSNLLRPDYLIGVMLRSMVEVALLALAMTLIILTGGIDLSIGSTLVLSAMVGGMVAEATGSGVAGLVVTLLVGLLCGLFNSLLIVRFKISPLIATLATMYLYMGLAKGMSRGDSVYSYGLSAFFGKTNFGVVPLQLLIYIALAALFIVLQEKTTLGRKLYGIGLNENATRYAGINTDRIKVIIYVISGVMAALASLIWLGRFNSIKYDAGTTLHMRAITIVVLGGTSINGGVGRMSSTVIAALIIAVLNSGLTLLSIPIDTQTIVQGVVLILSLIVYSLLAARENRRRSQ